MYLLSAGQNLVSEQEDEAETGDAGVLCCRCSAGDVPTAVPGPVPTPQHRRPAAPLPRDPTGLLPAECPADGPSELPSPPETSAILLLRS